MTTIIAKLLTQILIYAGVALGVWPLLLLAGFDAGYWQTFAVIWLITIFRNLLTRSSSRKERA